MQDYLYSAIGFIAIAVQLIINYKVMFLPGSGSGRKADKMYRYLTLSIFAYYITDAVWGILAGLGIAFSGSYVESGDITFHDVQLEYAFDRYPRKTVPLSLEKIKTADGRWVYYAAAPGFRIPKRAKGGLPFKKELDEKFKRSFGLRFTPEGDPPEAAGYLRPFHPTVRRQGAVLVVRVA